MLGSGLNWLVFGALRSRQLLPREASIVSVELGSRGVCMIHTLLRSLKRAAFVGSLCEIDCPHAVRRAITLVTEGMELTVSPRSGPRPTAISR